MSTPFAEKKMISFDGGTSQFIKLYEPDRYRSLEGIFSGISDSMNFAVQGAGLSYPALSFGAGSSAIKLSNWNRILAFDVDRGEIEVEAGISLGDLAAFTLCKGWYLRVQPGHPSIQVGGCVGSDVHGKNQFSDGCFMEQVRYLRLYHPSKGFLLCSREENAELFTLTCGGMGLTGIILSVGLKLGRVPAGVIDTETILIESFHGLFDKLESLAATHELLYTWHDLTEQRSFGRGFIKAARFVLGKGSPEPGGKQIEFTKLASERRGAFPGFNLLNPLTVKAMNWLYRQMELSSMVKRESLMAFLFPVAKKTTYFDLFGRAGFFESQVLVPATTFEGLIRELRDGALKFQVPITVASCKLFAGQQKLLRFTGAGIVLAIDIPRMAGSAEFLGWWDDVVIAHQALPSIIKDSRLPLSVVKKCYPEYEEFRARLHRWDSRRLFKTAVSERLEL